MNSNSESVVRACPPDRTSSKENELTLHQKKKSTNELEFRVGRSGGNSRSGYKYRKRYIIFHIRFFLSHLSLSLVCLINFLSTILVIVRARLFDVSINLHIPIAEYLQFLYIR